jgi:hypothetical protein
MSPLASLAGRLSLFFEEADCAEDPCARGSSEELPPIVTQPCKAARTKGAIAALFSLFEKRIGYSSGLEISEYACVY